MPTRIVHTSSAEWYVLYPLFLFFLAFAENIKGKRIRDSFNYSFGFIKCAKGKNWKDWSENLIVHYSRSQFNILNNSWLNMQRGFIIFAAIHNFAMMKVIDKALELFFINDLAVIITRR